MPAKNLYSFGVEAVEESCHLVGFPAFGHRGEAANVGEEDPDLHFLTAHRRHLEAPAAEVRVLARRGESGCSHELSPEPLEWSPADGTARAMRQAAHDPGECSGLMALEHPDEVDLVQRLHAPSMTGSESDGDYFL
ncbi:MAG: hypothetical protein KDB66_04180, partial [Solirubrobacterales bacterium]|nr:hypothetical protein [Solirubrobacterales bacterium]